MKAYSKTKLVSYSLAAAALLSFCLPASAFVLDSFSSKTGWVDTLNGGSATVAGGLFTIHTDNPGGSLTYSIKTANPTTASLGVLFTPTAGHTLELRVNANNVLDASQDTNALAILSLVPSGGTFLVNGYSLVVGANDVKILKGPASLYATNGVGFAATNVTLVLRITPSGSTVLLNARVYAQVAPGGSLGPGAGAFGGSANGPLALLFEYTATDSSANLVGVAGNAALGVQNGGNPNGSSISYGSLQVFDIINSTLDDFSSGNLNNWGTFFGGTLALDSAVNTGGQVELKSAASASSAGFAGIYYATKSFVVKDGSRLEFTIDVVNNPVGAHSYSVINWCPATGSAAGQFLQGLIAYHVSNDGANIYNGKAYQGWWSNDRTALPTANFRLILDLTGEGPQAPTFTGNCRIESRVEDLSKGINDPERVVYANVSIDTPVKDFFESSSQYSGAALGSGKYLPWIDNAAPSGPLSGPGVFAIETFADSATPSDVIMNNAVVNQTIPPVLPPVLNNLLPKLGANFLPTTTHISFTLSDASNVVLNSIAVTVNGVVYTNGSPGVTINPTTATAPSRTVDVAPVLAANVTYSGTAVCQGPTGLSNVTAFAFDTFSANTSYVVESEEYNFSTDYTTGVGGSFIDSPIVIQEGSTDPNAYNGQIGLSYGTPYPGGSLLGVDYYDEKGITPYSAGYDVNHVFRYNDQPQTGESADFIRAKYSSLGPSGGGTGFYNESEVTDIRDDEWLNYTHHYPAGTFNVFMRSSLYKTPLSLVTLGKVTSDRTTTNQTTTTLGSFFQKGAGTGNYQDVPLTDGLGNPVVLRMDGSLQTLRVTQVQTGESSGGIMTQNYFVFVPTPDPGSLPPIISSATPLPGSSGVTLPATATQPLTATIANRDTTVNVGSIVFSLNGVPLGSASVTPVSGGAVVTWPLSALPGTRIITNTISFTDSASNPLSYSWTYSLPFLAASNSLPVGSLGVRGIDARMVQSSASGQIGGNDLTVARQVLAIPPAFAVDNTATSIVQVIDWDQNNAGPNNMPGFCQAPPEIDSFAIMALTYVELTAGGHRFHIIHDDRAGLYSGANLQDSGAATLYEPPGGSVNNGWFDFVAEAPGLYPLQTIWEQGGGGAYVHIYATDPATGTDTVFNDPANPSGVVRAWYPLICKSSSAVLGPYTVDSTAANAMAMATVTCVGGNGSQLANPNQMVTGGTLTIPAPAGTRFYRMDGPRTTHIDSIHRSGSNIVITYTVR